VLGRPQRAHGTWAACLKRTRGAWVLPQCWAHSLHRRGVWAACLERTRGAWVLPQCWTHTWRLGCVGHDPARAQLGDTWLLGHAAGPKGNGFGVITHGQ